MASTYVVNIGYDPPPSLITNCDVDGRTGFVHCRDTGITVCSNCLFRPGILWGVDHRLPGTTVMCAHQSRDLPWFISGTEESVRWRSDEKDGKGILHWAAGRCWCDQFHRDQAATLEFDPWRLGLSTFAPRPELLG